MSTTAIINGRADAKGKRAELRAKMAELDARVMADWYDPVKRGKLIEDLAVTIYEGFLHENLLELFTTVESVGEAERITLEEVRGLEVFWVSVGGQIDESRLTEEVWELPRDYIGYHVSELEEKMRSGFSRASANIVQLAIDARDAAINQRLLGLFQTAIPGISSPYYIGNAGLSLPALNTAITEVQDETKSDMVSIIGRATMVNQIMDELADLNGFTPETNEEMLRLGRLGSYRGANIVKLRNYRDADDNSFFPANEMYVVGSDASKVGFWGGMISKEWVEQGGWYWHNLGRRTCGMALNHPERVRRIVDTSMAA